MDDSSASDYEAYKWFSAEFMKLANPGIPASCFQSDQQGSYHDAMMCHKAALDMLTRRWRGQ